MTLIPTRYLDLGDTELYIEENDTGSISDIDSALIVHDKVNQKSLLNLNDCIFNQLNVDRKALGYYIIDDGLLYNERIDRICSKLL